MCGTATGWWPQPERGCAASLTVSGYTRDEDFSEAALVVTSLGDPGGDQAVVLANRSAAAPGDYLTLDDVTACQTERTPS